MICRYCGKELGEGQDTCSDCYGNPHLYIPPWPRGKLDFEEAVMRNKIKGLYEILLSAACAGFLVGMMLGASYGFILLIRDIIR